MTVFYVSSNRFFQVSLDELFASNINLKIFPKDNFVKIAYEPGWNRVSANPEIAKSKSITKERPQEEVDLKGLRNQAAILYPRPKRLEYELIFSHKEAIIDIEAGEQANQNAMTIA
jgi:hypothetical protein